MNKRGFTLVELLAVIVILSLLALITSTSVTKLVSDAKNDLSETQIALIKSSAETWMADNLTYLPDSGECSYLTLKDLKNYGLLDSTILDPKNNHEISDNLKIKISTARSKYGNPVRNVEVNPKSIDECSWVYVAKSFKEDSWQTIAANVIAGNLSKYKVGDTKEIALTGYTNGEANSNGLYTVRIANTSTPTECNQAGFSQSACGFVIEFVDIITTHNMNPSGEYKGRTYDYGWNKDGWPASDMYKFLNDTTDSNITSIYESLPQDLQEVIKPTQVVSSHGSSDSTNFTSTDKLYLLSTKEVWGKEGTSNTINYDTAEVETRQLDYYKDYKNSNGSIGVTTSNYTGAIKNYNGSASWWWLRSASSYDTLDFYGVNRSGAWYYSIADIAYGVASAFRIG